MDIHNFSKKEKQLMENPKRKIFLKIRILLDTAEI